MPHTFHPSFLIVHSLEPLAFAALDRAIAAYKGSPEEWAALRGRIMADASRWSWDVAAGSYVDLYNKVLSI